MKKFLTVILSAIMAATVCACGSGSGGGGGKGSGNTVTLLVDLHGWTPTINTTATASTPIVYSSPRYIAEEFENLYPEVKIEWVRNKNINSSDPQGEMSSYFVNAIAKGTCPAIAFTWGTTFQERDYYVDLTEYLNEPNPFEENEALKGKPWKEAFNDYIWELESIRTYDGRIAAVPVAVYAGTASAIYYNCALMTDIGLMGTAKPVNNDDYEIGRDNPFTWEAFMDAANALKDKYRGRKAVTDPNANLTAGNWLIQFNLGPAYMKALESTLDTDGDGKVSGKEKLQGVVDGVFDPATKAYAREMFEKVKYYYADVLNGDMAGAKDTQEWMNGQSGFYHDGSWCYSDQKSTPKMYEFSLAPAPMIDNSESEYVSMQWVRGLEEYQPSVDLQLNLMKPAFYENGVFDEKKFDYALKFLQYLTTYEANSAMISEMNTSMGAVKGVELPSIIKNTPYTECWFPVGSTYGWPTGFTSSATAVLDTLFSQWVKGSLSDSEFYSQWNGKLVADAKSYAASLGIALEA